MNILAIIPARGGSKGIPRKNIRPLCNKPLIHYSIHNALSSIYDIDVYVSSDDEEVLSISEKFYAKKHLRNNAFAGDHVTLDPVIYNALNDIEKAENKTYDYVITLQPTSPLLKSSTIDKAIDHIISNPEIDTLISAKEDTHLNWKKENNKYFPNYELRLNRQYLKPNYRETGGFLITKRNLIDENNRIGKNVDLFLLSNGEELDIDSYEDWSICEFYLKRKKILFVVSGNKKIGMGHVYNTLLIANDILNHNIQFIVDKESQLAYEKIISMNYKVSIQTSDNIISDILKIRPDIVINDRLENSYAYVNTLKKHGMKVITFEDIGKGASHSDLVINAVYSQKKLVDNFYFGHHYFLLRDEFMLSPAIKTVNPSVASILLSFGGTDPNNYTQKVLDSIYPYCIEQGIKINIVAGIGYERYSTIKSYEQVNIYKNINRISDFMRQSDIIFSACGRTTYEIASLAVPSIVMAQNERELTHYFPYGENGFINLGLGTDVNKSQILNEFKRLVTNKKLRQQMSDLMRKADLRNGRKRVFDLVNNIIEGA